MARDYTVSVNIRADGSQAKRELSQVGAAAEATAKKVATPSRVAPPVVSAQTRTALARPRLALAPLAPLPDRRQIAPPTLARPKLALRNVEDISAAASTRAVRAVTMTIKADGQPAREEADKPTRDIDAKGKQLKPWQVRLTTGAAGVYNSIFKGLGSDIWRGSGMDRLFTTGMTSGLGRALAVLGKGFTVVGQAATMALSGIFTGFRLVASTIGSVLTLPLRAATTAFKALGVAGAAAAAGVYAGLKAIGPAADMEQYRIQLEVLLKDADKARTRLAELSKYAKETTFSPKEIIEAGNLMEAFGFYSKRNLELAGSAANSFGKDIREIVTSLNYLASGRGGEAFESLSRIGVTREKLKPFGVKFEKSGELITEPKKALDAVLKYFEKNFGGMTARQSKTWKGAIQQLGGEVYNTFAVGFERAVGPLTNFVRARAIPLIESIGKRLTKIDWGKMLEGPLKMLGGASEMMRQLFDPETSQAGMENLKAFGKEMWAGLKDVASVIPLLFKGVAADFATMFEAFVGAGGMGKVIDAAWQTMKLAWEFGASLLSQVLSNFSLEFQSGLKVVIEKLLPGGSDTEAKRRRQADVSASAAVLNRAQTEDPLALAAAKEQARQERLKNKFGETARYNLDKGAYGESIGTWRDSEDAIRAAQILGQRNSGLKDVFTRERSKSMGWDSQSKGAFYRDPEQLGKQFAAARKSFGDIKLNVDLSNTKAGVKVLSDAVAGAVAAPRQRLATYDAMGSMRERYDTRMATLRDRANELKGDPELEKLRRKGWNKSGEERRSYTNFDKDISYSKAREQYRERAQGLQSQLSGVYAAQRRTTAIYQNWTGQQQRGLGNGMRDGGKDAPAVTPPKADVSANGALIEHLQGITKAIVDSRPANATAELKKEAEKTSKGVYDTNLLLAQNRLQNGQLISLMQKMNLTMEKLLEA